MSYRTDQFFRINEMGERGYYTRPDDPNAENPDYTQNGDNGGFLYPAREVRTNDHNGYKTETLRRGYIRSLRTQADGVEVDIKKCGFQFNPSTLDQSIEQLPGMLNVFQQDASQFAQPIPGNTGFSFELLFDRTMEVNNPRSKNSGSFNVNNPWELSDASEVGVLKDLATLYATIGQGVSSSMVQYLTNVVELQMERERNDPNSDASDTASKGAYSVPDFMSVNVGNTAFLLPVPIRIVFSSLYIVEGFVQTTSTRLVKFSTQMVPLQAKVTLTVDAKYIGFAKSQTFLTVSLDKEIEELEKARQEELNAKNEVSDAFVSSLGSCEVGITYFVNNTNGQAPDYPVSLYDFLWNGWDGPFNGKSRAYWRAIPGKSQTPVTNLFKSQTLQGVLVSGRVEVFGPYNYSAANDTSQAGLLAYVQSKGNKPIAGLRDMAGGPPGTTNANASTASEWERTSTYAAGKSVSSPLGGDRSDDYFIVKYSATVWATAEGQKLEGRGEYHELVRPNSPNYTIKKTIGLSWPSYGQSDSGLIVPSNDSPVVARQAPGSTSQAGGDYPFYTNTSN